MKNEPVRSRAETFTLYLASISMIVGGAHVVFSILPRGGSDGIMGQQFALGLLLLVAGAALAVIVEIAKKVSAVHREVGGEEPGED